MPKPEETLKAAAAVYVEHGKEYGDMADIATIASDIATSLLGKPVTPYEICLLQMAVIQAKIVKNPGRQKNYTSLVNYVAFASGFAPSEATKVEKAA